MVEAIERVLFDWPLRLFSKTRVQIGPLKYRVKRDGVIVCYSLVDQYFEGSPKVQINALFCPSRRLRHLFRRCLGNLSEQRNYPALRSYLICEVCGKIYGTAKDKDRLAELIAADLRRKGQL